MARETSEALRRRLIEVLRGVDLFEDLTDGQLALIAGRAVVRRFEPEQVVVLAETRGDSMMVILEGQVRVFLTSVEGREVVLSHLAAGEFFGEMSLIAEQPRSASVAAAAETQLAVISRATFLEAVRESPELLLRIASTLCRRLRQANEKIANLAFRDVTGRLAHYLIELAGREGTPESGGLVRVRLPSHRVMASELGTVRETVSRAFGQLREGGYVKGQDRCWLVDRGKLERLL
jgi:CRP-like cAMP-binding protein